MPGVPGREAFREQDGGERLLILRRGVGRGYPALPAPRRVARTGDRRAYLARDLLPPRGRIVGRQWKQEKWNRIRHRRGTRTAVA